MTQHHLLLQRFNISSLFLILLSFFTILNAKETFGKYSTHRSEGRSIIVTTEQGQRLRITPYGEYIVRVQAIRANEEFFPDDRYEMVESLNWSVE